MAWTASPTAPGPGRTMTSPAGGVRPPQGPPVLLGDLARDGQSEPRPARLRGEERLEEMRRIAGVDPAPCVLHADLGPLAIEPRGDEDPSALRRGLDPVLDEVQHGPPEEGPGG